MRLSNPFRRSKRADNTELKGFYADKANNRNEFFRQLLGWTASYGGLRTWTATAEREALFMLYADKDKGNSTVYSVVTSIANAAADVMQYAELLDRNNKPIENHWTKDLLQEPNDAYTMSEFIQLYMVNLLVIGDAFVYGQDALSKVGGMKYSSMYVMPSHMVEIISGGLLAPIAGYRMTSSRILGAKAPKLNPANVMFAKLPNPAGDTFNGLSPLISALKKVEIMETGDKRLNTSFNNGGAVNFIFPAAPEDNSGLTVLDINKFDEIANEGVGKKTKFVNMPLGSIKLGDTVADLSILETSEYATQAICNVYAYPLDLLYSRSTYSNMNEAKKMRYLIAIPYADAFLEKFAKWTGISKEGLKWKVNTDKIDVLKPNLNEVITAMINAGTTINERREYLGYERLPEPLYDQVTYSMNMAFGTMDQELDKPLPEMGGDEPDGSKQRESEIARNQPE